MENSSFYVTCPSNASMNIYRDNTLSSYKINMPKRIYLKHNYEVGLAEIQYPVTWNTMPSTDALEKMYEDKLARINIEPRMFNNILELVTYVDKKAEAASIEHDFDRNAVNLRRHQDKIFYSLMDGVKIRMTRGLAQAFGFIGDMWLEDRGLSTYPYDVRRGFHSMYVYCNVVDSQIVGDTFAPLLRTISVRGNRGDVINETFDRPHYVPVNTDEISTIEINIKDDTGDDVSFQSGKVLCKLHFRQRSI